MVVQKISRLKEFLCHKNSLKIAIILINIILSGSDMDLFFKNIIYNFVFELQHKWLEWILTGLGCVIFWTLTQYWTQRPAVLSFLHSGWPVWHWSHPDGLSSCHPDLSYTLHLSKKPNLTYLYHTLYTLNHFLYFLTLLKSNFAILPINIINNHYHTFQKLNLLFLCTTISLQQIFCFLKVYLFPLEICFHFLSISLDKKRSHVVVESMSQSGPQFLICLKYSIINK